jgi:hypothetical protein
MTLSRTHPSYDMPAFSVQVSSSKKRGRATDALIGVALPEGRDGKSVSDGDMDVGSIYYTRPSAVLQAVTECAPFFHTRRSSAMTPRSTRAP